MITSIETKLSKSNQVELTTQNPIKAFMRWSEEQQFYRLPFLVGMLLFQGCVTAPFALWSWHAAGGGDIQLAMIVLLTFAIQTTNLSAQPTKVTIPVFAASTLILTAMMIYNIIYIIL